MMEAYVKKIGKNAVWHLIGKSISTVLSIILVFWIARLLGPEAYGNFSLTVTFIFLFQQFTSLGLELSLPYFIQKYKDERTSFLKKYLIIRLGVTISGAVILFLLSGTIAAYYNNPELSLYLKITAGFITFFILMNATYQIFQGFNNLKQSMKVDVWFSSTKFLSLLFIMLGLGVTGAVMGYGFSYIITTLVAYKIIYEKFLKNGKEFTDYKKLGRYALTSYLVGIFSFLSNYLINLYIGMNPAELGYFDAANKVGVFIALIPSAISAALLPSVTNKNKKEIKELTNRLLNYMLAALIPMIIIFISTPGFIINLLLSSDYSTITGFFYIIIAALSVQTFNTVYNAVAYGVGKPKYVLGGFAARTIIIFSLSSSLTGAYSASLTLFFSITASALLLAFLLKSYVKYPLKQVLKSLLSAAPLALSLLPDYNLLLKIVLSSLSLVFYVLVNYYKVLKPGDRELIRLLFNKIKKTVSLRF